MNSEILSEFFVPQPDSENDLWLWDKFLSVSDENVLWIPSGGSHIFDLGDEYISTKPALSIHTDTCPRSNVLELLNEYYTQLHDSEFSVHTELKVQLAGNDSISFNYELVSNRRVNAYAIALNDEHKMRDLASINQNADLPEDGIGAVLLPRTFENIRNNIDQSRDYRRINAAREYINTVRICYIEDDQGDYKVVLFWFLGDYNFLQSLIIGAGLEITNMYTR